MNRKETLELANKIVNGEREGQYGNPEDNFNTIAWLWSDYLGQEISPENVAIMMILLKIARCKGGQYKDDNFVDICGYAAIANELTSKHNIKKEK